VKTPETPLGQYSLEQEDVLGMASGAAKKEAERCLNCGCIAVNPSDVAAALVALDAKIVTTKRTIKADDLWSVDKEIKSTVLENDEIVTGVKSYFIKFALRKSIDFPIVNCAAAVQTENGVVKSSRVCLNAVYNKPYRAKKAEAYILGKPIDEAVAEAAGEAVVADAIALPYNKYKIQIAKAMVKKAILACK
jgi:CO/xanthine dehydrogenase FAD-binding subunit